MMRGSLFYGLCLMRKALILVLVGVLVGGCAAPYRVSARVTSFQQWPAYTGTQYYKFVPADSTQNNNLEYETFQDMVRAGIGVTGLVEARSGHPARFKVSFKYGVTQIQTMARRFYNPYPYYGYNVQGTFMWERMGPPEWMDEPVLTYRNALTVQIQDIQNGGKEVYRGTVYSTSGNDKLFRIMPYLVKAIFDGFPGNNGSERELNYTEQK